MTPIRFNSLSTGYRTRKGTVTVARNLTAELPEGELVSLIGPNGAGKSTLMKTVCGFMPALEGSVELCGKDVRSYSREELARTVAVVLTERPAVISMTVEEMVAMGRSPYTGFRGTLSEADREIARHAMRQTGIEEMAARAVDTLSDGERQKVMIAKALAQTTPVILLDEPAAFLDYPSKVELMLTLRRLAREEGKTILLSTHDLNIALELSDRLLLIDKNIGAAYGRPAALSADGTLRRFFPSPAIRFDGLRVLIPHNIS